jgi:GAF domain-containing protein
VEGSVKRRNTIGRKPTKARDRKTTDPKRVDSAQATRNRRTSNSSQDTEVARLTRELNEALAQQVATSEVLKVVSQSGAELAPVLDKLVATAARICLAESGFIFRLEGGLCRMVASFGILPDYKDFQLRNPIVPDRTTLAGRTVLARDTVHIEDASADPHYTRVEAVELGHQRTMLGVPLVRESALVGVLTLARSRVDPFTNRQIALVQNFASQAVIAIENTRLLSELRESLDQQTATAEILGVISRSLGDLAPVFESMLANAVQLCQARFGLLYLHEDGALRTVASHNVPPALADSRKSGPIRPGPGGALGHAIRTKQTAHIADLAATPAYAERDPPAVSAVEVGGVRTVIAVPMLKDNEIIGIISIFRQEVRPFTDKQVALLANFAAQAVIAIEDARLLNELRESLDQQTATSEVLGVISSSPGDLAPVFQAMLENATRVCHAKYGTLFLYEQDKNAFRGVAVHNVPPRWSHYMRRNPLIPADPKVPLGRLVATRAVVHIADITEDPAYIQGFAPLVALAKLGGARTLLVVPMLKENQLVGAIGFYRQEVRPFTDKQIELVEGFASQAVIAIENARLLNELRARTDDLSESLERQTAISEILRVISNSPSEVQPVLDSVAQHAASICEAQIVDVIIVEDGAMHVRASFGNLARPTLMRLDRSTVVGRSICDMQPVQVADLRNAGDEFALGRDYAIKFGHRSILAVPLIREGRALGAILVRRTEVRSFEQKHIALLTTFADQAAIAIENVRLFNDLRKRTEELSESLQQQTAASEVLGVISSSPGELAPVFDAILENATRICEAKFGNLFVRDGDALRIAAMHGAPPEYVEQRRRNPLLRPRPETMLGQAMATRKPVQIADIRDEADYAETVEGATGAKLASLAGARTVLSVPILREGEPIGAIIIFRREISLFTEQQVGLVTSFAAQAVIAIENARLLNELRELLRQQTATADVLKTISRSTFNLKAVLSTLVESAARLCEADQAVIGRPKGATYYFEASYGVSPEFAEFVANHPAEIDGSSVSGRVLFERRIAHVPDVLADPEYTYGARTVGGFRTLLGVPILREGAPLGVITLARNSVRPFTDRQIELVVTFADQAGIAIENVRLFDEVQARTRELEVASKHKSQFLANMSHELRTPLNAILGYTELILDSIYGEPTQKMRPVLERLQANGKHLLGLINDVLDLSKIEAGQLTLSLEDYSLSDLVHGVVSAVEPLAAKKRLAFKAEVAPDLPTGRGDAQRLSQVLLNLVGNAIKFTDKGEVAIRASATNGAFTVSVCDTGPGIAAAEQAKIFEEFQQADSSITRKKGGTGLGLSIVKRIIDMHGGRIWVDSVVDQGSTFSFMVPIRVLRQVDAT